MSEQKLTGDQVAAWLRDHTDFFQGRQELLEMLRLPDPRGEAVSLLERQAQILRERNHELRDRLNGLLAVARENDQLFEKTRQLVLTLIEARSAEQLFSQLIHSLQEDFGADTVSLLVYDRDLDLTGELRSRVRCLAAADLHEALQLLLRNGKAICGVLREVELEQLFPHHAEQVKSAAMVPLEWQGRQGLLAIGSFDPLHFRSSLGTLFISHIGDVLSRRMHDLLRKYPRLEARRA
ncbi:hypothetical protein S7S_01215 [Isoalcanivorax pacificus W11-5]|uniref:Phytochrome sensor protein n=1 Tax=Isoalcanivorax pacificus W11-5 TaxID=391936 RepID=A0A0B4XJR8_9GAMM|nr:DUF484 family protein [Isoalcanivorax pacificus]AJD46667.1 hypothetical protein S7S_01215 [Isoalcanivorax pacificus W11-5]